MSRLEGTIRGSVAIVARVALWPARVAAARAALAQLAAMDARELADIGLTAQDVRDATAVALDDDPTRMLAERARDARARVLERRPPVRPRGRKPAPRDWARTGS